MRASAKFFAWVMTTAIIASSLAACDRQSASSSPVPVVVAAVAANQVTGEIEVRRPNGVCMANVKIHNGTTYHLNSAGFNITGFDGVLSVKDVVAGGDDNTSMNVHLAADGSCLAAAQKIEAHATDNNVGTCTMDGVSEGECQHMFAFHSAINRSDLQGDIDKLKSGTLKIGDAVPVTKNVGWGTLPLVMTEIGGGTPTRCSDNSPPNWTPQVADIHQDGDGVADGYAVNGACPDGANAQGWVERQDPNP